MSLFDRFSLLLLEPGEIYFEDFSVMLHRNPDQQQQQQQSSSKSKSKSKNKTEAGDNDGESPGPCEGRLKICSKSLVFVPSAKELKKPLVKFPFSECHKIEGNLKFSFFLNHSSHCLEEATFIVFVFFPSIFGTS